MPPWSVLDALEIVVSSPDEPTALMQMLDRITETARDTIPRTDYSSVIVWYSDGHLEPFVPTHDVVRIVDDLQCESGEGPCVDALAGGQTVSAGDLAGDTRWPSYGPRVAALGIRSQLAMRIHDGRQARIGLNLYSRDRSAFGHPIQAAGVLVQYAGGLLTSIGDVRRIRDAVGGSDGSPRIYPDAAMTEAFGPDPRRSAGRPATWMRVRRGSPYRGTGTQSADSTGHG
jgi:hypothetical protein